MLLAPKSRVTSVSPALTVLSARKPRPPSAPKVVVSVVSVVVVITTSLPNLTTGLETVRFLALSLTAVTL